MARPSDTFWQDGQPPYLLPGLQDRENAVKDYAEEKAEERLLRTRGGGDVVQTIAASGAARTLDLVNANVFHVTLTEDCTFTFAGAPLGVAASFAVLLRQDATGGRSVTWPGTVRWQAGIAPVLVQDPDAVALLTFMTVDAGANWFGQAGDDYR